MIFTVEEENLICIYDTTSRTVLIKDIRAVTSDYEEAEMRNIAENVLRKLEVMSNEEFSEYVFSPAYYNEEETEE